MCSHIRTPGVEPLVSENPLVRGNLLVEHTVSLGRRFGISSGHSDLCGETVQPSLAPEQTVPPHAPRYMPNSWRSPTAPVGLDPPGDFCGCGTHDFYDWQTAAQSETAADSTRGLHPH